MFSQGKKVAKPKKELPAQLKKIRLGILIAMVIVALLGLILGILTYTDVIGS